MISTRRLAAATVLLAMAVQGAPASAQREIVQPLPGAGEQKLSDALSRLARNSQDVTALLDAGEAALELDDIDAAIGFFGRANELSPGNPRTSVGLARAYTRSHRPIEALRLFAEAERAGVPDTRMAQDRGLAFDLVGDAASAQQLYRLALDNGAGAETVRRLALSQAISGDREAFEATLLPLLRDGDVPAFRTRAFGLAVLGNAEEAKDIANTVLPAGLGARMAAYLDYMPRLTRAQQAAAGNLGVFPRTSSIGTDEAAIAAYAPRPVQLAQAAPAAAPQAQGTPASAGAETPAPARGQPARPGAGSMPPVPADRLPQDTDVAAPTKASAATPAPTSNPVPAPGTPAPSLAAPPARQAAAPEPADPPAGPRIVAAVPDDPVPARSDRPEPTVIARVDPTASAQPVDTATASASLASGTASAGAAAGTSIEDAFDGFTLAPPAPPPSATGAVDITRIAIPREKARPKPPPPPAHPARHWVQVATGKDRAALKFDWRRITRSAEGKLDGTGPFVTPWVEANRLLSGPYDSAAEAREMVNELKKIGVDSFPFTSAEGEAVEPL